MKLFKNLAKGQLKNIDVELISLLFDDFKPANGKGAVVKCSDSYYFYTGDSVKYKADDQGQVFVTVIEADTKDSQGDIASKDDIKKACYDFSKKGMIRKNDINHNMQAIDDVYIAENYILRSPDKDHFPDTKLGSWVQVIKFNDTKGELWQKVKSGKFNGVSLYGKAEDHGDGGQQTADSGQQTAAIEAVKTEIINAIKANSNLTAQEQQAKIAELNAQIANMAKAVGGDGNSPGTDDINAVPTKALESLLETFNKAIDITIKGENTPPAAPESVQIGDLKVLVKSEKNELYKAIADVDSGKAMNVLSNNLSEMFVDTVVDFAPETIFTDITVAELSKDEKLDKGFISDLVLKNSADVAGAEAAVGQFDLSCPTEILTGSLKLSQETVEFYRDKKGDAAFGAYVEEKLSQKIQKAIKKLLFMGDRASGDASLKAIDGIVKKMTGTAEAETITFVGTGTARPTYAKAISDMLKTFTEDALSEMDSFKIYCSPKTLLNIQDEYARRQTATGDKFLITNDKVTFKGMEIKPAFLPADTFIVGISKFLILGYRTDATIKIEHSGSEWVWRWYVRVRFGTQYISGGLVKMFELVAPVVEPEPDNNNGG